MYITTNQNRCDNGSFQTVFLKTLHSLDGKDGCHLTDILSRLHPKARDLIMSMVPDADMSKSQKCACYVEMQQWLLDNRAWAYPEKGKSQCVSHGTSCPTYPWDGVEYPLCPDTGEKLRPWHVSCARFMFNACCCCCCC